ncbi:carboxy-S-adenosyl-L-methionine synthase CmoA [Candidatus Endobugula sertula]|uniref:Carboxy-S-adenosyl-L-methionine synthase n=1 Tax=Candidatus Endobugula sertula TaxID=62101 RepID=A0A1D2QQ75_9GAMM|nr:carboxy-S-adenosyl-L-methionine synthase CmoA [Candidatus Endobugula sertula]
MKSPNPPVGVLSDTLFAKPMGQVSPFCFDDKVASVFADMIKRSVPGYSAILSMIGDICERYAQPDSHCYDLGCSLGAATLAMRHGIKSDRCRIISIDNSQAMIDRCQKIIDADEQTVPVDIYCKDIQCVPIEKASVVVLNFTLQFIELVKRQALIQRIYDGLLPGGILLLSEKIHFDNEPHQNLMTELYHNFKRVNGYSDLEIAQKRTALEKVLRSDSMDTHRRRLQDCGFTSADIWFQCFTFCSFIAIK